MEASLIPGAEQDHPWYFEWQIGRVMSTHRKYIN